MKYFYSILIMITMLYACDDSECYCTETTTDIRRGEVYVEEYWIDDCYEPFQQVVFYEWGNRIIDCR